MWFTYMLGIVLIAMSVVAQLVVRTSGSRRMIGVAPALGGVAMMVAATFKLRRRRHAMSMQTLIRRTTALVVVAVVMQIPAAKVVSDALEEILRRAGLERVQIGALVPLLVSMLFIHLAASLILPWSLWESARPVLVILLVALLLIPFAPDSWPERFGGLFALAIVGLPGMLICWLRYSRFREVVELRFLNTRYAEVQRELQYARRIHEKLFPAPIPNGPVQFGFRYEPMSQIGGDFVDVIRPSDNDGALTFVLVDVTGHGIVAALAVNRLHGEIKRTLAAQRAIGTDGAGDPLSTPSSIMASLNDYVHLTLADESVFGTALAVTIDPRRRKLSWVNAGHPPAFLCRADGRIDLLDSTSMMLGAIGTDDFDSEPQTCNFAEGDVLIAYTDGAVECRGKSNDQLGIDGLRAAVESARHRPVEPMLDAIMSAIAAFRAGAIDDDTLVLAIALSAEGVKSATARAKSAPATSR